MDNEIKENFSKKRNTKTQKFRDIATEKDWIELVALAESTNPIGKDIYENYGFSWKSVREDALKKGYYTEKRKRSKSGTNINNTPIQPTTITQSAPQELIIRGKLGIKKIARSVQMDEDVYKRLKEAEARHPQYTNSSILNHLITKGLELYGL